MGRTSAAVKNRYAAKVYDAISLKVKKGNKGIYQQHATGRGESLTEFLERAAREQITRDNA